MIAPARPATKRTRKQPAATSALAPTPAKAIPGVVAPNELYTLDELRSRVQFKDWAFRHMRREGLRVRKCHGRSFVLGSDFIEFVIQASEERPSD